MSAFYKARESETRYYQAFMLAHGAVPSSVRTDVQQAMFEDPNVYCIDIVKFPSAGFTVTLDVNGWRAAYEPALTYDRALDKADSL